MYTLEENREFIGIWNNAESRHEVAEHFGISVRYASERAAYLRRQGYDLKRFWMSTEKAQLIGAIGGKKSRGGGFAAGEAGRERAIYYGRIGGQRSRRGKSLSKRAVNEE